jgi:3-hydroxyacyl-CoA dehydrogenase/enoyl-CoA hydratase/3-hydroxybutyryl-CoA epimerase
VKKVGILGAGMMGAGIAYVSAKAGIDVVLLDTTQRTPTRARPTRRACWTRPCRAARPRRRSATRCSRIQPTTRYDDLQGCDLVVEAVFEDRAIKASTNWPRR